MTGSWEAMNDAEARAVSSALARDNRYAELGYPGSTGKYIKGMWDDAIVWSNRTRTSMPWRSLSERVAVEELRKGERSIYYPEFHADGDVVELRCPKDGVVCVDVDGHCPYCGFPFDGMPRIREDEK